MVIRTEVARTRLTPDEKAQLADLSEKDGVTESEYLRNLIVWIGPLRDLWARVDKCEQRLGSLEAQFAARTLEGT